MKHRKKDGSLLEVAGASNPIEFHGRRARLVLAIDVSEKKRLEAQLLQAHKMEAVVAWRVVSPTTSTTCWV